GPTGFVGVTGATGPTGPSPFVEDTGRLLEFNLTLSSDVVSYSSANVYVPYVSTPDGDLVLGNILTDYSDPIDPIIVLDPVFGEYHVGVLVYTEDVSGFDPDLELTLDVLVDNFQNTDYITTGLTTTDAGKSAVQIAASYGYFIPRP
ncbi:MAG: hypothetical protein KDK62_05170, partial [Chlamydiia bacterium]|nr:hypothetical protein [Chlamydiia bacterium]